MDSATLPSPAFGALPAKPAPRPLTREATEVRVHMTVREADDRGCRCVVVAGARASYSPAQHEAGIAMIAAQGGIFGWVARSGDAVAGLDAA